MKLKFPVIINNGNNTSVTIDLEVEQCTKLLNNIQNNTNSFCENEDLSELYVFIKDKAYDKLAESIQNDQAFLNYFLGGKYNFPRAKELIEEMFQIEVNYPEF